MANTSSGKLSYWEETTFGVLPTPGAPTLQDLRFVSESIKGTDPAQKNPEIEGTRLVTGYTRTSFATAGDVEFVLSYGTYDDFFRALFMVNFADNWEAAVSNAALTAASVSGVFTAQTDVGLGMDVDDLIRITDTTAPGVFFSRITVWTDKDNITVVPDPGDDTYEETERGEYLDVGSALVSFLIERDFTDLNDPAPATFHELAGNAVSGMTLTMAPGGFISGRFNMVGKTLSTRSDTIGDGSNNLATTTAVMSSENDVEAVWDNNIVTAVRSFEMSFQNSLIAKPQLGELGPTGYALGQIDVTGTIEVNFEDNTQVDRYINQTAAGMVLILRDSAGNAYGLDLPAIRVLDIDTTFSGGPDSEVVAKISFGSQRLLQGTTPTFRQIRLYRWAV